MCGFVGLAGGGSSKELVDCFYQAALRLQHRGQESAGASWSNGALVDGTKGMGLVPVVFDRDKLDRIMGDQPLSIIGHTRYSTAGGSSAKNAQPHWQDDRKGRYAIALNGDVPDLEQLKQRSREQYGNVFKTENDAEFILSTIDTFIDLERPDWTIDFIHGIRRMMQTVRATYSGGLITGTRLYVFRDPHQNRPLYIGRRGSMFVAASETSVFDAIHAEVERPVQGGEILVVEPDGKFHSVVGVPPKQLQMCIFEYIYFSRPDSKMPNGRTCSEFRRSLGVRCAKCARARGLDQSVNCIFGVPDSGNFFSDGYSCESGLPLRIALVKDQYVGRTFIDPEQNARQQKADRKYATLPEISAGLHTADGQQLIPPMPNAALGEDSIVRLTTMLVLSEKLHKAGYNELHLRISSPAIVKPCQFGIDMKRIEELIAAQLTEEQIRERLGATSLLYLPLDQLDEVIREGGENPDDFCRQCFGAPCAI